MSVLECTALRDAVECIVTTRDGGRSGGPFASLNLGLHVGDDPDAVEENRRLAARIFGAELGDLVLAEQVHGSHVAVVGAADRGRGTREDTDAVAAADGLVTGARGLVLVTMVADCVPLVLADPVAGVLATVHAGWRGTAGRVVGAAVETMTTLGAHPGRIAVAIGPAVDASRYQVGPEVGEAVADALETADGVVVRDDRSGASDRFLVDLVEANRRTLIGAGIRPAAIYPAAVSTGGGGPFFSDRQARPCGRFALMATLKS